MKLTLHGAEHILGRTKMTIRDVLNMVSSGAVVELGSDSDGYEFLLFYSPFDGATKIAVTASNRSALVSIWESDFYLPPGVRKATPSRAKKARKAQKAFAIKNASRHNGTVNPPSAHNECTVTAYVLAGEQVVYTHNTTADFVPRRAVNQDFWPTLRPVLEPIASVVEANKARVQRKVVYLVEFFRPGDYKPFWTFRVKHKTVMQRLKVA